MVKKIQYAHGSPSWVDLSSPDPEASKAFYGAVFGWNAEDAVADDGTYLYTQFTLDGLRVAGLGPQVSGTTRAPAWWNTFVTVDDVNRVSETVRAAGGNVLMSPMDVFTAGRMAVFADPTGAIFSVWQPGNQIGSELVNAPNTYSWNELMTKDVEKAKRFYAEVFGWTYQVSEINADPYTLIKGGPEGWGGIVALPEDDSDEAPSHWLVYFTVADVDDCIAVIKKNSGGVLFGPMDVEVGRFATVQDPQGGIFAVIQPFPYAA